MTTTNPAGPDVPMAVEYASTREEDFWTVRLVWILCGACGYAGLSALAGVVSLGVMVAAASGLAARAFVIAAVAGEVLGWGVAVLVGVVLYRGIRSGRVPRHPALWLAVTIALLVCVRLGSQLVVMVVLRGVSMTDYAGAANGRYFASLVLTPLVSLAMGVAAVRLHRRRSC